jgi:hypothetical protein
LELKNRSSSNRWNFRFLTRFHVLTLISPHQDPIKKISRPQFIKYNNYISFCDPLLCLYRKNDQKRRFFTTFFTKLIIFLSSRWNISTNEPVLERLLNFWFFEIYFTTISNSVQAKRHRKSLERWSLFFDGQLVFA